MKNTTEILSTTAVTLQELPKYINGRKIFVRVAGAPKEFGKEKYIQITRKALLEFIDNDEEMFIVLNPTQHKGYVHIYNFQ
jgi:hypothetical protein